MPISKITELKSGIRPVTNNNKKIVHIDIKAANFFAAFLYLRQSNKEKD